MVNAAVFFILIFIFVIILYYFVYVDQKINKNCNTIPRLPLQQVWITTRKRKFDDSNNKPSTSKDESTTKMWTPPDEPNKISLVPKVKIINHNEQNTDNHLFAGLFDFKNIPHNNDTNKVLSKINIEQINNTITPVDNTNQINTTTTETKNDIPEILDQLTVNNNKEQNENVDEINTITPTPEILQPLTVIINKEQSKNVDEKNATTPTPKIVEQTSDSNQKEVNVIENLQENKPDTPNIDIEIITKNTKHFTYPTISIEKNTTHEKTIAETDMMNDRLIIIKGDLIAQTPPYTTNKYLYNDVVQIPASYYDINKKTCVSATQIDDVKQFINENNIIIKVSFNIDLPILPYNLKTQQIDYINDKRYTDLIDPIKNPTKMMYVYCGNKINSYEIDTNKNVTLSTQYDTHNYSPSFFIDSTLKYHEYTDDVRDVVIKHKVNGTYDGINYRILYKNTTIEQDMSEYAVIDPIEMINKHFKNYKFQYLILTYFIQNKSIKKTKQAQNFKGKHNDIIDLSREMSFVMIVSTSYGMVAVNCKGFPNTYLKYSNKNIPHFKLCHYNLPNLDDSEILKDDNYVAVSPIQDGKFVYDHVPICFQHAYPINKKVISFDYELMDEKDLILPFDNVFEVQQNLIYKNYKK